MKLRHLQAAQHQVQPKQLHQYPAARDQYLLQDVHVPVRADPFIIAAFVVAILIRPLQLAEQLQLILQQLPPLHAHLLSFLF